MAAAMLDRLKSALRDQLGLPAWAALLVGGLVSHIVLNVLLRKPLTSAWGILAPLTLGSVLEAYEIFAQYRDVGLLAPGNDPVWIIIARHLLDVIKMLALPVLLVLSGFVSSR